MSMDGTCLRRVVPCRIAAILAVAGLCAVGSLARAQEDGASSAISDAKPASGPSKAKSDGAKTKSDGAKTKPRRGAHRASPKPADNSKTRQAENAPAPRPSEAGASDAKAPTAIDFTAQLDKAGASACRSQVNALATSTMGQVEKFNTVSNWSQVAGNKRAVSLSIGQKYADGSAVPFGVSQIISAPNQQNNCDSFLVQVLPSPLTCAKLRESIVAQRGTQLGDLAGVALMQNGPARTMLVPTASGTCVLVSTRTVYGK